MTTTTKSQSKTSTAASTTAAAKKNTAAPAPAGLSAAQQTAYAKKLIATPDLAAEKARIQELKKEASGEKNAKQVKAADQRLGLIAAEQKTRSTLAAAKLADGTTGAQYAKSAQALGAAELTSKIKQLAAQVKSGSAPKDAQTRLTVLTRERDRRAAVTQQQTAAKEKDRLDAVKAGYEKSLAGKTDKQLTAELNAEHQRLTAAHDALTAAQASGDPAAIATAEKNLRSEYARAAVIDHKAPPEWDHPAMHDYANTLKTKTLAQLKTERAKAAAEYQQITQGSIRGTRLQIGNAQVKLAIIDAAIAKKTGQPTGPGPVGPVNAVDKTRNPGNVVFDGPGFFIDNAANFSPDIWIPKLKAAGTSYVMLQIQNGGPRNDNIAQLGAGWADKFRAAGIKVGFWSGSDAGGSAAGVAARAQQAAQLTAQYHGDFYVSDIEGPFQDKEGDPALNKVFVDNFQAEATKLGIGNIPRALSSMGRVALDMKPWIDNGWDAIPQAYWNDFSVYQPSACVKFYEDWGWPKGRIHPTIATYGATGDGKAASVKDYVADLKLGGTRGVSYYLPENYMDGNQWQQWVDGLAAGMNGPAH